MRLRKYTHSCVRIESDTAVLVIDPGIWTERAALDGVDAILITHEHADHIDVGALADALARRPAVRVFTHPAVAERLGQLDGVVTTVNVGEEFTAAGMAVRAYGGWHAQIHPDIPRVSNLGYLIDGLLYHPGDSFDLPDLPPGMSVDTLFVPISAPWLKLAESVDFVRAIRPRRAFALHDCLLSDAGYSVTDANMVKLAGCEYGRLPVGEPIDLP